MNMMKRTPIAASVPIGTMTAISFACSHVDMCFIKVWDSEMM